MSEMRTEYDFFRKDYNARNETKTDRLKKKWLRCKEATIKYGVSRTTIMKWALQSGALLKNDATVLIDSEAMDNYLEGFRVPGGVY